MRCDGPSDVGSVSEVICGIDRIGGVGIEVNPKCIVYEPVVVIIDPWTTVNLCCVKTQRVGEVWVSVVDTAIDNSHQQVCRAGCDIPGSWGFDLL
jgi:hypothetical protein